MSKILIVDDEPRILLLLQSLLKANGYVVETARDGNAALDIVRKGGVDIAVTDLRMAPMDGMSLFREIKAIAPAMPVILLTAYASVETAIEAMKSGIFDYLTKPFKVDDLIACLKRAEEQIAKSATTAVKPEHPVRYRFENFIASSPMMMSVCDTIQKVAPTAATVLINGESGTGKEVIARTIHRNSTRAKRPWVAVNCAAIPENLLESEMFGHVKGSFTGAVSDKEGLFEAANGGTLFLDEISSMPLILQGKLLRVLHRFAVITIDIPPLRKRPDDIIPLARHFIRVERGNAVAPEISADAAKALMAYDWPGNVRELENAIKHALTFYHGGEITCELLPQKIREHKPVQATSGVAANASLKSFLKQKEREYIEQILSNTGGDKEKAAETLKVNLSTLYRKLSDD